MTLTWTTSYHDVFKFVISKDFNSLSQTETTKSGFALKQQFNILIQTYLLADS